MLFNKTHCKKWAINLVLLKLKICILEWGRKGGRTWAITISTSISHFSILLLTPTLSHNNFLFHGKKLCLWVLGFLFNVRFMICVFKKYGYDSRFAEIDENFQIIKRLKRFEKWRGNFKNCHFMQNSFSANFRKLLKRTVSVISSDPPCKFRGKPNFQRTAWPVLTPSKKKLQHGL